MVRTEIKQALMLMGCTRPPQNDLGLSGPRQAGLNSLTHDRNGRFANNKEASPQQGDLRLSGPPTGQGAGGGAQTYDRRVPDDPRASHWTTNASTC
ncbi:hypothetical protein PoB_001111500 [Plakobranchus ocellatus]|uniref:Uncharacterized protein n=1 Tax=Plakobranchus ocellatus TaxID=259542 RepID=A0AAV3YQ80_9GAST|nr:hypothetical protein PoB_001111500 [Plakobranchus ocellatus]